MKQLPKVALDLIKARELIADRTRWCTGTFYTKYVVPPRYCAAGAVMKVTGGHAVGLGTASFPCHLLDAAAYDLYGHSSIIYINDGHLGHEGVLRCYDRAIEMVIQRGD